MPKNKMSLQTHVIYIELCPRFIELDRFCPIELILTPQIIPFILIDAKTWT